MAEPGPGRGVVRTQRRRIMVMIVPEIHKRPTRHVHQAIHVKVRSSKYKSVTEPGFV